MNHRTAIVVAGILAAWVAAAVVGQPTKPPTPPPAPIPTSAPPAMGLAGCAARGCHGGPTTDTAGKPLPPSTLNACTVWLRGDRHADAFRVLLSQRSKDMIRLLKWDTTAESDVRCLACHTSPSIAAGPSTPEVARVRMDGVGCDACHTSPGRSTAEWVDAHKSGTPADLTRCYGELGMKPLNSTKVRADVCAGCHVGAPAGDGLPVREVTHDLIAAGHPRLNFDYATFLASMPPHWTEKGTPDPVGEWFTGKVTASQAGLKLVADQATRDAIWPELAAYNCIACHHVIPGTPGGTDWRQARFPKGDAGKLTWGGMPYPLHQLLPQDTDTDFTKLLTKLNSDPAKVAAAARSLDAKLATVPSPNAAVVLRSLDLDKAKFDWDDASQAYYALAAVNRARAGRVTGDAIDGKLLALRDSLRLGPTGYDPDAVLKLLRDAAQALSRR
jgi:hypothetical protein